MFIPTAPVHAQKIAAGSIRRLAVLFLLAIVSPTAPAAGYAKFKHGKSTIRVPQSARQSASDELRWRLHSQEIPGKFDISKEKFELIIPPGYSHQ
jgi:hypothetical protein